MNPQTRIRALVVAIFLVGAGLRLYHLDRFPERNRTADEYAWTWSGMTLLTEGTPRAWSWLGAYPPTPVQVWRGNQYRIVKPWLDHPPLYSLYVGAFMRIGGTRDIFAVELWPMRLSSLLLWAAAFFLFWRVARRYAEEPLVLVGLAFWAAAPPAVWNGRLVMAEQMMLPLALAGWWALLRYLETRGRGWLVLVAVAAALLPLCKIAALGFVLFLFTVAVLRREWRLVAAVCVGAGLGLLVYAGYGAHFGWPLFRSVLATQAQRFTNFGGFWALMFHPRVVEKDFMYLPFLLGFFTLLADLRDGRNAEVGLFAVVYAACIAFFLPWNEYGWYLIPLYPALTFGIGSFVVRAWRDAAPAAAWPWLLFSVIYLCWIACDVELSTPSVWRWIYLAFLIALPLAVLSTARAPRRFRVAWALLVSVQWITDAGYALRK